MRRQVAIIAALVLLLVLVTFTTAASNRHARLPTRRAVAQPQPTTTTTTTTASRVAWYTRSELPQGWTQLSSAAADEQLTFTLVVKGSNAAELERRFKSRSDPDSDDFGEWMTNAEIEALVAPSAAQLNQLYDTLAQYGITAEQVTSHGDSFDVSVSVSQASALFATQFFHFQHSASGMDAIRQWGDYSLPATIAEQAELVLGVHTFPTVEQRSQMRARRAARNAAIAAKQSKRRDGTPIWVPQALAAVYGVPHPIAPLAYSEVGAGVIEWEEQTFSERDLYQFSNATAIPIALVDQRRIVGNNSLAPAGVEASLDIQWIEGLNPGSTPWFWLINDDNAWMYTFTVQFLSAKEFPAVVSMSYGVPELDNCSEEFFGPTNDCNGVTYQQYQALVDKQFMKMGLLGVTVVSANSDNGVYNSGDPDEQYPVFLPNYPGTSEYVTTAGATEMANPKFNLKNPPPACSEEGLECISSGNEQAVSADIAGFLSGGGFSNVTARPSWQADAVNAYLQSGVKLPDESLWNRSGRAIPDVTAQGYNGYVIDQGESAPVSGTSMSTPIVASIFALLHHDYHNITNTTLGFLNPLLYKGQASGAGLFTDITVGDNCADDKCKSGHVGFECTKGWDPVSGLGSPYYPAMKKYVQQLARRVVERRAAKQQQQQRQQK